MIRRFLTVKLQGSRAVVDAPIYLYQNDRDICLAITMVGNKYQYDKETKLSFTLIKPNGTTVDSAMASIINGKYHVVLSRDLFDDEDEVGQFLLQIKQYQGGGVVSLPPFAIHVLKGYSQPLTDDGLLTDEDYLIITENEKTIQIKGTVKISDLPTTQIVDGYLPISQGEETFKLDMSILPTKAYVANEIAKAQLDGSDISLDGYATLDDLALVQTDLDNHNHDERYALSNHSHQDIMEQTYSMGYSLQQQMTNYAMLDHTHSYNDLEDLPTIPSIDGLASEEYVDNAVANVTVDTSGLASKQELSDGLATKADVEHKHNEYLTEAVAIDAFAFKAHEHAYLSQTDADARYSFMSHNHGNDYASTDHNHDFEYAPRLETSNALQNLKTEIEQEVINRTSICDGLQNQIEDRAFKTHYHYGYASIDHKHNEYASSDHEHLQYVTSSDIEEKGYLQRSEYLYDLKNNIASKGHTHSKYAPIDHIHNGYASKEHTHSQYLTEQDLSNYATKDEIPTVDGLATETYVNEQVATKANVDHTHTELALANHSHDEYALANHEHQEYLTEHQDISHLATKDELVHNHDSQYAPLVHGHDYAPTLHEHSQYLTEHQDISMKADKTELHSHENKTVLDGITETKVNEWDNKSDFDGDYNSLINKPTIPTVDVNKAYVDEQLATKSNVGHGHLDYAKTDHNHDGVYATSNHTHDEYATKTELSSKYVTSTRLNDDLSNVYNTFRSECATKNHAHSDMLSSYSITRIEVVDSLPSNQETGVLYIVKVSE